MKKAILVFLLLALTLAFAACGQPAQPGENTGNDQQQQQETPADKEDGEEPAKTVELGVTRADFRVEIIDASDAAKPVSYLDAEVQLRSDGKSAGEVVVNGLDVDIVCLQVLFDGEKNVNGLNLVSYETTPETTSGDLVNDETHVWNVYKNGEKGTLETEVQTGDELVFVYESRAEAADLSKTDRSIANKYLYIKNDCIALDFTMEIRTDSEVLLEKTPFIYYMDRADYIESCVTANDDGTYTVSGGVPFSTGLKAVCEYAGLEYANNEGSVCINDYLGGSINGEYHFWNFMGSSEDYMGSHGTTDSYGTCLAAGSEYLLYYV